MTLLNAAREEGELSFGKLSLQNQLLREGFNTLQTFGAVRFLRHDRCAFQHHISESNLHITFYRLGNLGLVRLSAIWLRRWGLQTVEVWHWHLQNFSAHLWRVRGEPMNGRPETRQY